MSGALGSSVNRNTPLISTKPSLLAEQKKPVDFGKILFGDSPQKGREENKREKQLETINLASDDSCCIEMDDIAAAISEDDVKIVKTHQMSNMFNSRTESSNL